MTTEPQDQFDTSKLNDELLQKGQALIPFELRQPTAEQVIRDIDDLDIANLDLERFAEKVVNLIRDRFGLYFVGLFVVNVERRWAILQAGSGKVGPSLKRWSNPVHLHYSKSTVSEAINLNKAQVADGGVYEMRNPRLPDMRIEIAIPLQNDNVTIGAFMICSCLEDSLSERDFPNFTMIAERVAPICASFISNT